MLNGFEVLERDEAGYSQVNALYAMIGAMRSLPGRKSILLFSEGVAIPPAVQRLFLGVIDAANRANVSIYTMDAAGLRAESEQAKIRDEVNKAGARNLSTRRNNVANEPMMKSLEKNEDVLRQDAHTGLGRARAGHRRPTVREHEQPSSGLRAPRQRSSQLLPGRLHAGQRHL